MLFFMAHNAIPGLMLSMDSSGKIQVSEPSSSSLWLLGGKDLFLSEFLFGALQIFYFFLILFFFHQLVSFVIFAESFQTNFLLGHSMKLFLVNVRTLKELKKDYRFCCSEKCFAILQVCINGKVCHICCQYLKK